MKTFRQLLEDIVNSTAGGGLAGVNAEPIPVVQKRPRIAKRKVPTSSFAGMTVFDVDSDDYHKSIRGRSPYQRWSKHLNMSKYENAAIRDFSHRNKGKSVIVRHAKTGAMSFLKRGS